LTRVLATWALARVRGADDQATADTVGALAEALRSRDAAVRLAAARAIGDLRPRPALMIAALETSMQGADPALMAAALDVLALYGEAGVPGLIDALKQKPLQGRAAMVLARIGPAAAPALAPLLAALDDPAPAARQEILFALSAIGPAAKPAVPALVKLLTYAEEGTNYAAAYALGKIGPPAIDAKPALQNGLQARNEIVRVACAWALARIDPECSETPPAVPVLMANLARPEAMTRLNAAASLRCLGPQAAEALPALKEALNDDNELVREMAAEAIRIVEGPVASQR
jgi:HEAT repeat protein